jgi:adenylate cyclase
VTASHATFLFADIAGFTALTEAHGDEQAATLVADFCEAVRAELPAGAAHVKTIGDALMLRVPDPSEAILLALHLTHEVMRGHGAPAVRVGLHHGPAVERDGDYFGATVNLAARVSGLATGGEVLAAVRQSESTRGRLPVDPVCRMAVDPDRAAGRLLYEGTAYFFCTLACAGEFAREPERFVT